PGTHLIIPSFPTRRSSDLLGFVDGPGPDGKYLTGDEPPGLVHTTLDGSTAKLSYQMSKKVKLIGVYQRGAKVIPEFNADRFTPRSEEHTSELQSRGHLVCR